MKRWIKNIFGFIKEQIYPCHCPVCGRLQTTKEVCFACSTLICRVGNDCCDSCGYEKMFCCCSVRPMRSDGFTSPFYNVGRAAEAMKRFKYKGAVTTADFFAISMAERFVAVFPSVKADVICSVPADRDTLRSRGYNQAAVLATKTAEILEIPVDNSILVKKGKNLPQHTLKGRQRQNNVKGIYAVQKSVKGKTVILIDDIRTTGATINECARVLKRAKAKKVYALSAVTGRNLQ